MENNKCFNNKCISIQLFRVSADSQYLDMIFDCPVEFYFNSLTLEVRYWDGSANSMKSLFFDLSKALFNVDPEDPDNTIAKKHWVVRLPLEKLGVTFPAIYKGTIKAQEILEESSDSDEAEELCDHMICSDVNYAYKCMLNDLLDLDNSADPCIGISDDAIRKYLLLYGHQAALATGDDEVAERFFKLIGNCFEFCPTSCGCGCNKPKPMPRPSGNCNCGR